MDAKERQQIEEAIRKGREERGERKYVDEAWQIYAEHAIPADAHVIQYVEERRAFYAGAMAVYSTLMEAFGTEEEDVTDKDLAVMAMVHDELTQFMMDVVTGKA